MADLATKAIKKTDEECIVGSQLLAVLSVQLGIYLFFIMLRIIENGHHIQMVIFLGEELSSEVPEALLLLCPIMTDCARILGVRSAAALSIGITAYFACETEVSMYLMLSQLYYSENYIDENPIIVHK